MSNPFIIEQKHTVDRRNEEIGSAWFSRQNSFWEKDTSPPLLSGGEEGGSLKSMVLDIIREAKEVLIICSFLISDIELLNAILTASDRGVRVYILTASKDRIAEDIPEEKSWKKQMQIEHEQMLNSLCSKTLLRDAQVHAKFIIADPKSDSKRGVLSTANFTTEAFLHPELGIILESSQIEELFEIFLAAWWGLGERELLQPNILTDAREINPSITNEISAVIHNLQKFVVTFPNRTTTLRNEIKRLLQESQQEIFIATYGVSDDDAIFDELASCAKTKNIRLLVRQRPKTTPHIHELKMKGADVRGLDHLHAKVIYAETEKGKEALIMTANLEKISLQDGFEVGLLLKGPNAVQILKVLNHWWDNANWEYSVSKKLGEHLGAYLVLDERDFEKHEVEENRTIPLGEQVVGDLAELDDFKPDFPKVDDIHKVEYIWATVPRELPKRCKPHKIEGFDETIRIWKCNKNRIFISVSNQAELDGVMKIAEKPKAVIVYHKN